MSGKKKKSAAHNETAHLHFLVVDDDATVRQNIVDYLKSFGFERITQASDGLEAMKLLRTHAIDFVISDWDMPGATGLDVLTSLKTDPTLKAIPFVMVTSPISQERFKVIEAATAHVDAYIIKPFRSSVLKQKIEMLLAAKNIESRQAVVVVDDDPMVLDLTSEYLKQMGYTQIYTASDGEAGFKTIQEHLDDIAFVVSDWEMPKMAGIDLLQRIRDSENDELANLPFIMITSQSSIERIKLKRAIEADVDHYLLKPFRIDDLRKKVDEAMSRAKLEKEIQSQMAIAEQYLQAGHLDDAERVYGDVIKRHNRYVPAYLGLAATLIRLGPAEKGFEKATHHVRAALAINPKYDASYIQLAAIYESVLSIEKAIACLKDGLNHCPFSESIHFHLGRLLLRRGHTAAGIEELKRALELKPDYQEAQELLNATKT